MGPKLFDAFPPTVRSISLCIPIQLGEWLVIGVKQQPYHELLVLEASAAAPAKPIAAASSTPKKAPPKRHKRRKAPAPVVGEEKEVVTPEKVILGSKSQQLWTHSVPHFYMSRQFPSLEVLEITGGVKYSIRVLEESRLGPEVLGLAKRRFAASLPATMQRVSLPEMGIFAWTVPESLPPTLRELSFISEEAEAKDGATGAFPPSLNILTLKTDSMPHGRIFQGLPDSVEHLEWNYQARGSEYIQSSVLGTLKDLQLHPSLATLELNLRGCSSTLVTADWFALLPRRLTSLKISAIVGENCNWSSLPSTLTSFSFNAPFYSAMTSSQYPVNGWDSFPAGLTELELKGYLLLKNQDFADFPRTLTRLKLAIHMRSFQHGCNLVCELGCLKVCDKTPRTSRELTDEAAFLLPPSLTDFRLETSMFGANFWTNLPPTITRLGLATTQPLKGEDLGFLPRTLTRLRVNQAPYVHPEVYGYLPKSVTKLKILDGHTLQISPGVLQFLPYSLIQLIIEKFDDIRDEHIPLLPRNMRILHLPQSTELSALCASDLPRGLQSLKVKHFSMPTTSPTLSRADLNANFPPYLAFENLPWTIGKGHRTIEINAFWQQQNLHQQYISSQQKEAATHRP
jgi:hypothetical protein